jgi:serine/threonine protein phosphatase PrpC
MQMMTAHIGDSRAYLLREAVLYRITRDHSLVQRMVDTGLLTSEQAHQHPDSNILSRAIGKQPTVEIETGEIFPLVPGDTVLLCSDGLWGPLTDAQIAGTLGRNAGTQEIADALVDLALENGSDDNITVQVLRFGHRAGASSAVGWRAGAILIERILGWIGAHNKAAPPPPPGVVTRFVVASQPQTGNK